VPGHLIVKILKITQLTKLRSILFWISACRHSFFYQKQHKCF
jgi:hypothetical protein